jgi:DNA oxidative demethylase
LSAHQDRNERDFDQPIVSVSLGLPAIFLWGGMKRTDPVRRVALLHGDVVVWGGPDRLRFHGVNALAEGDHPMTGARRINFTFRRAH